MSRYILVDKKNTVLNADYSFEKLRADNPNVSFRAVIPKVRLADCNVYKLADVPKPDVEEGFEVVFGGPELVNGVWTKTWATVSLSAEVMAMRKANADFTEVRDGAFYSTFKDMTPKETTAHVEAQITDLESAKAMIAQMAALLTAIMKRMG